MHSWSDELYLQSVNHCFQSGNIISGIRSVVLNNTACNLSSVIQRARELCSTMFWLPVHYDVTKANLVNSEQTCTQRWHGRQSGDHVFIVIKKSRRKTCFFVIVTLFFLLHLGVFHMKAGQLTEVAGFVTNITFCRAFFFVVSDSGAHAVYNKKKMGKIKMITLGKTDRRRGACMRASGGQQKGRSILENVRVCWWTKLPEKRNHDLFAPWGHHDARHISFLVCASGSIERLWSLIDGEQHIDSILQLMCFKKFETKKKKERNL